MRTVTLKEAIAEIKQAKIVLVPASMSPGFTMYMRVYKYDILEQLNSMKDQVGEVEVFWHDPECIVVGR